MPATVCFPFVGDRIGGSHISAALLLRNLDPARYRPLVVLHEEGALPAFLRECGVDYRLLRLPAYVGASSKPVEHAADIARTAPILRRFLRRENVDIVHAQDGRMNLTWVLPTRLAGRRFVWHQRVKYGPSRLTKLMMRVADLVVCNSDFAAASLPDLQSARVAVVENPFDTSLDPPSRVVARARYLEETGTAPGARIVGFVGNLSDQKRPRLFVETAARIKQAGVAPVSFAIFGADRDGLADTLCRQAKKMGVGRELQLMGFRHPIDCWIAACDVLLAPEVEDAFGRTLVEAMLVETPVIASDSGGHREIIDHGRTGFLVPADDAETMVRTALVVLQHPQRARAVAKAAREHARRRYSVAAHAQKMMPLYDSLLGISVPACAAV
ncbi:MAG: glycosyltransferase [Kiloniellaceae bacterium]